MEINKLGFNYGIGGNFDFGVEIVDIDVRISIWLMADRVFGPHTNSDEVYDVAAKPVVKTAMEGVNGKNFTIWIHDRVEMGMWCFYFLFSCVKFGISY